MGPWPMEEVEQALHARPVARPTGVAARDLTECLRIQLRVLGLEGSPADVMVRDHIRAAPEPPVRRRSRGTWASPPTRWRTTSRSSSGLDPQPGNRYSARRSAYIMPDVFVVKEGDEYKIVLNDDGLPKLRISPTYRRMLDQQGAGFGGDARLREGQAPQRAVAARRASTSGSARSTRWRSRSCVTSAASSTTASRTCGRWCCATWPTTSACTSRRCRGWWPTSTCTRRAASTRCASSSTAGSPRPWARRSARSPSRSRIRKMIEEEDASRPLSDSRIAEVLGAEGLAARAPHGGEVP